MGIKVSCSVNNSGLDSVKHSPYKLAPCLILPDVHKLCDSSLFSSLSESRRLCKSKQSRRLNVREQMCVHDFWAV